MLLRGVDERGFTFFTNFESAKGRALDATGVAALEDGWFLIQSPAPYQLIRGLEHETAYLPNEFVFERRVVQTGRDAFLGCEWRRGLRWATVARSTNDCLGKRM